MDRAHRLGQTRTVNVYRLLTRGTLEERIMGLQRFKLDVANAVVNTENASLASMDTTQILELFAPPSEPCRQPQAKPIYSANGLFHPPRLCMQSPVCVRWQVCSMHCAR